MRVQENSSLTQSFIKIAAIEIVLLFISVYISECMARKRHTCADSKSLCLVKDGLLQSDNYSKGEMESI